MFNSISSRCLRWLGGTPCFRIHGKAKCETVWREIDVFATERRDLDSRWPLWSGTCITWTDQIIVVGWDFAARLLAEQREKPSSREHFVEVAGGRLSDQQRRTSAGELGSASASEILAHECGHTRQARTMGIFYLPVVGAVTLFREGTHWWNHFENDASAQGQLGGIITDSVCPRLISPPPNE